jgi:putative inorganic carbon (HCO3(-)) transporter
VEGTVSKERSPKISMHLNGVYQGSIACRRIAGNALRLGSFTAAFYAWFSRLWEYSALGKAVLGLSETAANWASSSVSMRYAGWIFNLLFTSGNEGVTEGTFLGVVLGLGAFAPTEIQMLCFLVFLFVMLWVRSMGSVSMDLGSMGEQDPCISDGGVRAGLPFQILLPLLVLFLFVTGATVSSVVPWQSIKNLVLWIFNGLAFVTAFDIASRGREDSVIWPFLAAISVSSLVGLYQHFSGWQPPRSWLDTKFEDDIVRVVGTFKNPNYLAEMIGLALPLTLALLIKNRNLRDKAVMLVYACLQGGALIFTWSRGAWLGFLASFGVMAILFDKRLLVAGLIVAMIGAAVAPPVLVQRLLSSFTLEDSSNSYRISIWRGSIALIRDYLFRGVGLGAESFSEMYPEYMIIETPALHSHSIYLQMLIELGLFGFLALVWFLLANAWYSLSAVFGQRGQGFGRWGHVGILAGSVAAVAGHMLQGIIDHTWYNPQVMLVVWVWLGVAAGVAARLKLNWAGKTSIPE